MSGFMSCGDCAHLHHLCRADSGLIASLVVRELDRAPGVELGREPGYYAQRALAPIGICDVLCEEGGLDDGYGVLIDVWSKECPCDRDRWEPREGETDEV